MGVLVADRKRGRKVPVWDTAAMVVAGSFSWMLPRAPSLSPADWPDGSGDVPQELFAPFPYDSDDVDGEEEGFPVACVLNRNSREADWASWPASSELDGSAVMVLPKRLNLLGDSAVDMDPPAVLKRSWDSPPVKSGSTLREARWELRPSVMSGVWPGVVAVVDP